MRKASSRVIEEKGRILAIENGIAVIEVQRRSGCGQCNLQKPCASGTLGKLFGQRQTLLHLSSEPDIAVGQEVMLGLPEQSLLKGSIAVYGLPLVLMFVCGFTGQFLNGLFSWTETELPNVVFGFSGLALGFYGLRRYSKRISRDISFRPILLRQST